MLLAGALPAQVTTGTILGTVRDNTGALIIGATVTITDVGKGTSQRFETDDTGSYNAPFLVPGTYSVTVERTGFKKEIRSGIILQVDQKARIDFDLSVGAITESVDVSAAAPLIKTDSAELGQVIEERAVRELPLNGRNFAQLVYLAPGVTAGQQGENLSGASTFNPRAAANFNALGQQANTNGWLVDGIDNNEYTFNTVIVQPSVESVREFKVLTGTYSAEFGRGAGVVSVSTKSGTNEFHGSAFEFLRNDKMDARNYFNAVPQVKPPFRRNQFGASASGPIYLPKIYDGRNRTFIFGDYYGLREVKGNTYVNSVPTAATRAGNFSDYRDSAGRLLTIYDPLTTRADPNRPGFFLRDPFSENMIPSNRINAVGRNVASIYPLPNGSGNFNNYTSAANRNVTDDGMTLRVDHRFSDFDNFFARYSLERYKLDAPQGQAQCCLQTPQEAASRFDLGPYVAGLQNTRLKAQGLALNQTHMFRPNLLNEIRAGFARTTPRTVQSDFGHNAAQSLGIQGINVSEFTSGLPNIFVQDYTGLSGGPAFLPANPRQTHYQISDNLFWSKNRHSLKFGYHYVRRLVSPFTNTDTRSTLNFNRNFTNDPATNTQGAGLATLLIGHSTSGSRGFLITPYYMTNTEHGTYLQDDWKVSQKLTLNIGLRYEIFTPDVEIRDRLTNFDLANRKLVYAGEDGTTRAVNKQTKYTNFGPRFGFAYSFGGHNETVVRGGYGISYFPVQASASNLLGQQVPYTISQNFAPETNPTNWAAVPVINNPFPAFAPIKPRTTGELNAANPRVMGHSFLNETPYSQSWSMTVQRALPKDLMVEVGYGGSRGIHIPFVWNPNEIQPGTGSQASRRLIPELSNMSAINQVDNRNMSTFHSLQVKAEKRYSSGLQVLFSYTFGKSIDFGGSAASGGGSTGGPQTATNLRAGRGLSGFDVKHRAVTSYVWDLPFGQGKHFAGPAGPVDWIIGNWQLAGIVTLQTGRPFNVTLNTGVNNGAPSWPNRIGPGQFENPDPWKWFNDADFVAPPANTYGNVGRGVLYGPGQVNLDMSLVKNIPLGGERVKLQYRLDMFNVSNTPWFGMPTAGIGSPTVGRITSTNGDNRDLQMALKLQF
jgi:hypothetical protein